MSFSNLFELSKQNPFKQFPRTSSNITTNPSVYPRTLLAASTNIDTNISPSCEYGSAKYFALCGFGGVLSCGLTHTGIVPLDVVKCRIQVHPDKYGNTITGFRVTVREEGLRGLGIGWAPTLIGYSMQGMFKFGLYEIFKVLYSDFVGEERAYLYRTLLYLTASASAEVFADVALAPMEALKVRMQTKTSWAGTLREGFPKLLKEEGLSGFYKGLQPLWLRQIPYTMMKFAAFERTIEFFYTYVIPYPRDSLGKPSQLAVTFTSGYIAGIFCAVVSHPFDSVVSKLNSDVGSTPWRAMKDLGFYGVWKGLGPRILMVGTLTAAQWFIYDTVKVYLRIPRPPPPVMPDSLKRKLIAEGKSIE